MEQLSEMEHVPVKLSIWVSNGAAKSNGACPGQMEQISEMEHLAPFHRRMLHVTELLH